MTAPFTMEEAHKVAAEIAGELSLAITRKAGSKASMLSWTYRLRQVADAFEAKIKLAKGDPQDPRGDCPCCAGTGVWVCSPEEAGWRPAGDFAWVTDTGVRVPGNVREMGLPCPCTERKT